MAKQFFICIQSGRVSLLLWTNLSELVVMAIPIFFNVILCVLIKTCFFINEIIHAIVLKQIKSFY